MRKVRFNETRKWGIRLNDPPHYIELQGPMDPFDGFVGATYFTREAAEAAKRDSQIDGEVVPVLLLVIEVSKAEADAEYRYYKTKADRSIAGGLVREFQKTIIDSLRNRIALLQEELEEELAELARVSKR